MSCRRVLSSTPLLVRGSETGGDSCSPKCCDQGTLSLGEHHNTYRGDLWLQVTYLHLFIFYYLFNYAIRSSDEIAPENMMIGQ
jgi:hypothetical protein